MGGEWDDSDFFKGGLENKTARDFRQSEIPEVALESAKYTAYFWSQSVETIAHHFKWILLSKAALFQILEQERIVDSERCGPSSEGYDARFRQFIEDTQKKVDGFTDIPVSEIIQTLRHILPKWETAVDEAWARAHEKGSPTPAVPIAAVPIADDPLAMLRKKGIIGPVLDWLECDSVTSCLSDSYAKYSAGLNKICEDFRLVYHTLNKYSQETFQVDLVLLRIIKHFERDLSDFSAQELKEHLQKFRQENLTQGVVKPKSEEQQQLPQPKSTEDGQPAIPSFPEQHAKELEDALDSAYLPETDLVPEISSEELARFEGWIRTKATLADVKKIDVLLRQRRKELIELSTEKPEPSRSYYQKPIGANLYWYEQYYDPERGKTRQKYIGKDLPPGIDRSTVTITPYRPISQ